MPRYARFLAKRGMVVEDVHKVGAPKIPSPAGPLLILSLVVGEVVESALSPTILPLVIAAVVPFPGSVALVEPLQILGGNSTQLLVIPAGIAVAISALPDLTI